MIPTQVVHGDTNRVVEELRFPYRINDVLSALVNAARYYANEFETRLKPKGGYYKFLFSGVEHDFRDSNDLELFELLPSSSIIIYNARNHHASSIVDKMYEILGDDMLKDYEKECLEGHIGISGGLHRLEE